MRIKRNTFVLFLLISFCIPLYVFAYVSPGKPVGYVNDFAHVLGVSDVSSLESKLKTLNQSTGVEVAVVTIQSLGNETVETFATKLFEEWGIGQKGKDNGLLILVAPNDRVARIEVGYGLEGTVTDLQSGNIVRSVMIPAFKNGDFAGGINGAVDAVSGIILGDSTIVSEYSQANSNTSTNSSNSGSNNNYFALFFFVIIIFNVLAHVLGKTKSWWLGGVIGAFIGVVIGLIWGFIYIGIGAIVILTILGLIFDYIVSKHPPKDGNGRGMWPIIFMGGGRGGFGGGGSGGFGGFGGGMSGGGGASGRW